MIIPCMRCGKELDSPNAANADYVMAEDTIVKEDREVLVAVLKDRPRILGTDDPHLLSPDIIPGNIEEVSSLKEAQERFGDDLVRCEVRQIEKDIQKTGIICPDCYKDNDLVTWGVHKK